MRYAIVLTLVCGSALAADSAAVQHCQVMAAQRIDAIRWHGSGQAKLAIANIDGAVIAQRCATDPQWYESLPQLPKRTHCDSTVDGSSIATDCASQ